MTNPTPPRELVSALRAFDPQLRIRWGVRMALWIVERRMPPRLKQYLDERPRALNPWSSPRGHDLWEGWKDGYVHVLNVHPDLLDHRVFAVLAEHDAWRAGGFDRLAQHFEDADAEDERRAARARDTVHEALASDAYDRLAWLEGRRVAVTEPDPTPTGEAREGYVVRDRRVTT